MISSIALTTNIFVFFVYSQTTRYACTTVDGALGNECRTQDAHDTCVGSPYRTAQNILCTRDDVRRDQYGKRCELLQI